MPARIVRLKSLDHPGLDPYRDVRDKDLRGRDGLFMAESELVVRRLAARTREHPRAVASLLLSEGRLEALADVIEMLPDDIPVHVADLDLITRVAGFHVHRGVLAAGRRPAATELALDAALGHLRSGVRSGARTAAEEEQADRPLRLLVAEAVTNVDNMGAIFRNAAAFGAHGVVLDPDCCDPLYRKAIRVSMGHVLSVPWAIATDWPDDLDRLRRDWAVELVAAEVDERSVPAWALDWPARHAILLGAEERGVSAAALARCDHVASIPMSGDVPSLNVAVASAVMLYEGGRGRA